MFVVTVVLALFLAVALSVSAVGKLTKQAAVVQVMESVNFPLDKIWMLAVVEIAGALGLVVGLFWAPLGILAAIGVVLYFAGAVTSHLRVHDTKGVGPAAGLAVLALVVLVLRLVTA